MSDDQSMRASDAERDEAVSRLGDHAAAGRLTASELDERVTAALAARTRAELTVVEDDLPSDSPQPRSQPTRRRRSLPGGEVATYLSVMALLVAVWALTGAGYLWPVWPALGWGVALIGPGRCGHRRRAARRA